MSNNSTFPNTEPTITVLKQAADNFADALSAAASRSTQAVASKNLTRDSAIVLFNRLASYVETQGVGELGLISTGFSLAKGLSPIGILPKPTKFTVQSVDQGCIKVKLNSIHGADSYQYEYKLADAEIWTVYVGTKSNALITGLSSGQAYNFRVAAIGASPNRVYSDILSSYIL